MTLAARCVVVVLAVVASAEAAGARPLCRCRVSYSMWSRSDARGGGLYLTDAFVVQEAEEPTVKVFDLGTRKATAIVEFVRDYAGRTRGEPAPRHAVRAILVLAVKEVTVKESFLFNDSAEVEVLFRSRWQEFKVTKNVDVDGERTLSASLTCEQQ